MHFDLGQPAARKKCEKRRSAPELKRFARRPPRSNARRIARHRMADVRDGDARSLVERWFERKEREHPVDAMPDGGEPLPAPRPHRRAHEMNGAHPRPLEASLEAEVEIRGVDADEYRHAGADQPARDVAAQRKERRKVRNDFGETPHGKSLDGRQDLATRGLHFRPGDARKVHVGAAPPHGLDQGSAERIPGSFTGNDADGQGDGQRTIPRPLSLRNSTSGASTGWPFAACASAVRASSSESPARYSVR